MKRNLLFIVNPISGIGKQKKIESLIEANIDKTLIDYLGFDDRCICFGNSVFQQPEGWQVAYGCGYHQLVSNDGVALIEESPSRTFEEDGNSRLDLLKAVLQQYAKRMINNQLTTKRVH